MYCTRQGKHMDLIVDKKFRRHPKRKIEVYIPDAKTAKMSIPRSKLNRKYLQEINIQSIIYGKGLFDITSDNFISMICHDQNHVVIMKKEYE